MEVSVPLLDQFARTHAAVAANISTSLAFVTIFRLTEKVAVNIPMVISRIISDLIKYNTTMAAVGSKDASRMPTSDVTRERPT